jgi:hypothetical protein
MERLNTGGVDEKETLCALRARLRAADGEG